MAAGTRYQARVCDDKACRDVGKATRDFKKAQRAMQKEMKRVSKKKFKKLPARENEFETIYGEVWEKAGSQTVGDRPVYVGGEGYGSPRSMTPRRPRRTRSGPRVGTNPSGG
ncbi:MAG: hypothetical protein JXB32_24785 [Deltaproteobacteria bacterium]|nr:hypothetical protein [Deltaproteobacteria bacterium]